jgi:hypothetical protein
MQDFKTFVQEMTMSVGQLDFSMPDFSQAKHIGDTEKHKILHYEYGGTNVYGITVEDRPVGYLQTISKNILGTQVEEINQMYVEPQFRGKHLMTKLFFFLKSWLSKSFLAGNIQSADGQEQIKSLALTQRFPMFWFNITTGEKHPYDPEKDHFSLQPYRNAGEPTDWQILIEGLKDNTRLIDSVPQFLEQNDWRRGISWFDGWEEVVGVKFD